MQFPSILYSEISVSASVAAIQYIYSINKN